MSADQLLNKIKSLENQLKEKEETLAKYKELIRLSNHRIENIAKNFEENLSLIAGIHKHLLPVNLPDIPYFEFSYKFLPTSSGVSGDFFDVFKIPDSLKFGIIMASCNTYAMAALFISSFLKSSQNLHNYQTSKEFFIHLEKHLSKSLSQVGQIDLFYGIVDRKKFTLDYCLLGNIFTAFKKQGQNYQVLKACTQNLKDKSSFKNEVLSLDSKDHLMFCSSGIVDKENAKKEKFGHSRILKAAQEAEPRGVLGIRQNILFQCNQFDKNRESVKDQTILVMEVKDRVLKLMHPVQPMG